VKSVPTRNGLDVGRQKHRYHLVNLRGRLSLLMLVQTAQSLHPGGPYYPGQPYPDPAIPPISKESPLQVGTDATRP
jgi:hypothetical protein